MSIFEDRPNTVLLVIDVQNGVVDGIHLGRADWTYETAPGRSAGTLATAEVDFGAAG